MKFSIDREQLLEPLLAIQGVVERRQSLPILANVLMSLDGERLALAATDMEVELVASTALVVSEPLEVTIPARKMVDICRALPSGKSVTVEMQESRVTVRCGRSRFALATLPAAEFPSSEEIPEAESLAVDQKQLRELFALTGFSMAHQDVRYYLNGLLLEFESGMIRAVATDGHRLAVAEYAREGEVGVSGRQIIVPRKAIAEAQRILSADGGPATLTVGTTALRLQAGDVRLTTKLIDGRFPDYERVIPDLERCDKRLVVEREALRQVLGRAAILSNDKYRAVRLSLAPDALRVVASNPEQEEAEDELEVAYQGGEIEIGFNVTYLMDALNAMPTEQVELLFTDAGSSCLMLPHGDSAPRCRFVVMPMRL